MGLSVLEEEQEEEEDLEDVEVDQVALRELPHPYQALTLLQMEDLEIAALELTVDTVLQHLVTPDEEMQEVLSCQLLNKYHWSRCIWMNNLTLETMELDNENLETNFKY